MARILVVDDHRETCMLLMRLFNRYGHTAEIATSGRAALEYLRRTVPHFVVLDFMMPDMDGLAVLREIRAAAETSAVPVAIYTAVGDPQFSEYALQCGASDVWLKAAVKFDEMIGRMERLLEI
jgi:DNA-binding response OmpR family regulator